ncbi:MAG: fructose-bisphosphate aldolase [Thermotogae bacterium]|nr:fructose-bisphosphate aldolase [Thermotogota bacterium]
MEVFTMKRMYRIFKEDGKTLIVAMDHGSVMNVFPDLLETKKVLGSIVTNGVDAFLTTFGIVKNFWKVLKDTGIILRIDGGVSSIPAENKDYNQLFSVEDALRLGADAVACMGMPGTTYESRTLSYLSEIVADAHKWQVPVMAEMIPGGFMKRELHTPENITISSRIGVELGADFIKTEYSGDTKSFKNMVEGVYKPIVVLGGAKSDDPASLLRMVKEAIDSGASGVAIGRNIWGYPDPGKITAALRGIVHENKSVEEALNILNS